MVMPKTVTTPTFTMNKKSETLPVTLAHLSEAFANWR